MSEQEAVPLTVIAAPVDGWCEPDGGACHVPGASGATSTDDPAGATPAASQPATHST